MPRLLLSAAVAFLVSSTVCSGQEWARKMFEATSHDFGAVARGAKVEYRFNLSNLYEEDVHIAGVRSSCGCTTPTITKDSLKTYEKSAIVATFNTRAFLGQRSATLTVTIDEPFYAEVQLRVQGYIRSDVVLNPGGVEFGQVDQGSPATKTIGITYAGRNDWAVLDVKPASEDIDASFVETGRGGGQVSYELTVHLKPDAPAGYIKEQLILVTNDRRASEFPIDIEGRVVSAITVHPASLFMGALKPGDKVTKKLVVQAKKPFRITGVSCDTPERFEFGVDENAKSKPVHLLPVIFTAGDKPGKITYKIRIETDLGADATLELSAFAHVTRAPAEGHAATEPPADP
ncbi:MAG TPA: DUF1573 domain-containing protein [Pirellulales bacterium]|nr:DUF1573 domain-containing protein [Pirellulales bacterium]